MEGALGFAPYAFIAGGLAVLWLSIDAMRGGENGLLGRLSRLSKRWLGFAGWEEDPRLMKFGRIEAVFEAFVGVMLIVVGLARLGV